MTDPELELEEPDEPEPVDESAGWSDAQYWRSVALLKYDAEIEDDERRDITPNYDW